jgi:hypothetical protein
MKQGKREPSGTERIAFYWQRFLLLLMTQSRVQHYDLDRLYARNAYARFPGLKRTMLFWWLEGFLLWLAPLALLHQTQMPPLALCASFIPLWFVWFYIAYRIHQLDTKAMSHYREARQLSRFFRTESLRHPRQ